MAGWKISLNNKALKLLQKLFLTSHIFHKSEKVQKTECAGLLLIWITIRGLIISKKRGAKSWIWMLKVISRGWYLSFKFRFCYKKKAIFRSHLDNMEQSGRPITLRTKKRRLIKKNNLQKESSAFCLHLRVKVSPKIIFPCKESHHI